MKSIKTLKKNIDAWEPNVVEWWNTRHTVRGRAALKVAKDMFVTHSVENGGGKTPYFLTPQESSAKLLHNGDFTTDWEQCICYFSAHESSGVINMCPWATDQCIEGCLGHTSGRMVMDNVQRAQLIRTTFFVEYTYAALLVLLDEVERNARRIHAKGKKMALRLNGTSDYRWEWHEWLTNLLDEMVDQRFDYTKAPERQRPASDEYYLARSATERTAPADVTVGSVVVVNVKRGHDLPATYNGIPVEDGDKHDLRFLDTPGTVVLLRAKGSLVTAEAGDDQFVKAV